MRARASGVILILLFVALCCRPVFAQGSDPTPQHDFEGSPFGGVSLGHDFQFPTPVSGGDQATSRTVGMHYASGYQVGVRVTQNLGDFWGASLEYNFANQPLRFTNLSPSIQSLSLSHLVHHFSYDISYLPWVRKERFRPYGKFGAGAALFYIPGRSKDEARALGANLRDSWEFAFNWGGGFKHLINDQVALAFDAKDQVTGVPSYGLPRSARLVDGQYLPGVSRNGLLHNWQINLGIVFQWDE